MASGVEDNRLDVEIRLKARYIANQWDMLVTGEAKCRFGCGGLISADPRQLVHWADKHEQSRSHKIAKADWLENESEVATNG